jgi:hypothetical protein
MMDEAWWLYVTHLVAFNLSCRDDLHHAYRAAVQQVLAVGRRAFCAAESNPCSPNADSRCEGSLRDGQLGSVPATATCLISPASARPRIVPSTLIPRPLHEIEGWWRTNWGISPSPRWKRMALLFGAGFAFLWVLGWLIERDWFYAALGVRSPGTAMALVLFSMVVPVFTFLLQPLASLYSRLHEFEADAYAARVADARDLVRALVKLYEDNATTLTPDPLPSAFYASQPPAVLRIHGGEPNRPRRAKYADAAPERMQTLPAGTPALRVRGSMRCSEAPGWTWLDGKVIAKAGRSRTLRGHLLVERGRLARASRDHHPDDRGTHRFAVEFSTHR